MFFFSSFTNIQFTKNIQNPEEKYLQNNTLSRKTFLMSPFSSVEQLDLSFFNAISKRPQKIVCRLLHISGSIARLCQKNVQRKCWSEWTKWFTHSSQWALFIPWKNLKTKRFFDIFKGYKIELNWDISATAARC